MQTFLKLPSKTKQQHLGGLRAGTLAEPRMQMPTHGPLARRLNKNPPTTPDVHHRLSWPPRNIPRSCQDNSFGGTLCQHVTSVHANDYKCSFKVTWICVHVCARVCACSASWGYWCVCAERDGWASIETTHIKPAAIQSDVDRG